MVVVHYLGSGEGVGGLGHGQLHVVLRILDIRFESAQRHRQDVRGLVEEGHLGMGGYREEDVKRR